MAIVIIYTLEHPISHEIKYIGKTMRSLKIRYEEHLYDKRLNTYVKNWINNLKKSKLKPIMEILDVGNEKDYEWLETYWIYQFRSWGFKLCNLTDGGGGCPGRIVTKKCRIAVARANHKRIIGNNTREKMSLSRKSRNIHWEKEYGKPIYQFDKEMKFIKYWPSIRRAERVLKISRSIIINCCKNRGKLAGGFIWKYYYN